MAAACATTPHRPTEDVAWVLLLAVGLLAAGTAVLAARTRGPGRGALWSGAGLMVTGGVLLAMGVVVNAVMTSSPLWWLHDSDALGRVLPVLGGLVTGLAVVRRGWLPRWVGVALVLGAGSSMLVNVQDARMLLALPMGLAWILFGYAVRRTGRRHAGGCGGAPHR